MTPLEKRHKFTSLTVSKYRARKFAWGACDCGKIAAFHARKFGWEVPKTGVYKSAIGARKYLQSLGVETLPELLDKIGFARIAPASSMMGDFVSFESDDPIGGVGIVIGGGKIMAFHEDFPGPVMIDVDWTQVTAAWSIWQGQADG